MIRLYTLQRFAHFSPQDSIASIDFSHYMVFERRMTETQSFRSINSLLRADHTKPTNPLPADPPCLLYTSGWIEAPGVTSDCLFYFWKSRGYRVILLWTATQAQRELSLFMLETSVCSRKLLWALA